LTVSAGNAVRAEVISFCKQEFNDQAAVFLEFLIAGRYHLSITRRMSARRDKIPFFFDLNQTEPAGADIGKTLIMAQCRQVNAAGLAHVEDSVALFPLNLFTVNG
jgi:hypothetical protein